MQLNLSSIKHARIQSKFAMIYTLLESLKWTLAHAFFINVSAVGRV